MYDDWWGEERWMGMKNDYDDHLFLLCTMRAVEIRYPFESIYFV